MMQRPNPENPPPLKVVYPYGGKHFLLNWWTYDDRGHLFVAKREEQLRQMFDHIDFRDDTRVDALQEVDIVAPSRSMSYSAALSRYNAVVRDFYRSISYELRGLNKHKLSLPEMFEPCIHAIEGDSFDCDVCQASCVKLVGMTQEEFYLTYADAWEKTFEVRDSWEDEKRCVSQATPADDAEVTHLHMAVGDYGHHTTSWCTRASSLHLTTAHDLHNGRALFYYRLIRELDQSWYDQRIAAAKEKAAQSLETNFIANAQKHELRERERAMKIQNLFKGIP